MLATPNAAGARRATPFQNNAGSSVTGLDIYGSYLRDVSGAATLSAINAGRATAVGSNSSALAFVNTLTNHEIDATVRRASASIRRQTRPEHWCFPTAGAVTQSAPITATNLALLGAGGTYTLTNPSNHVGTLAANTGSVNQQQRQPLESAQSPQLRRGRDGRSPSPILR